MFKTSKVKSKINEGTNIILSRQQANAILQLIKILKGKVIWKSTEPETLAGLVLKAMLEEGLLEESDVSAIGAIWIMDAKKLSAQQASR